MAIDIFCPFCGSKTRTRTSERIGVLSVQASIHCPTCGQLSAKFVGQLTDVKRAVFVDCPEVQNWTETEKEQIDAGKLTRTTNEERLAKLRGSERQADLFAKSEQIRELTPLERQEKRQAVQRH